MAGRESLPARMPTCPTQVTAIMAHMGMEEVSKDPEALQMQRVHIHFPVAELCSVLMFSALAQIPLMSPASSSRWVSARLAKLALSPTLQTRQSLISPANTSQR